MNKILNKKILLIKKDSKKQVKKFKKKIKLFD